MGKKKEKQYVIYNDKTFLAPDSINSMAAIHCKIKTDGIAIVRISDCNNSIRLWNDLSNKKEVVEMMQKVNTLITTLKGFQSELRERYPIQSLIS